MIGIIFMPGKFPGNESLEMRQHLLNSLLLPRIKRHKVRAAPNVIMVMSS